MKFNFYTIKRKVKFILNVEDGKYKVIKQEEKPVVEKAEKGYRIKKIVF